MKKALILSGIYWDEPLQRHQQFAKYLSDCGFEVVFVERIMSSRFEFSKFIDVVKKRLFKEGEYSQKNKNAKSKKIKIFDYKFVNPEENIFRWLNEKKVDELIRENGDKFDLVINYLPINTTRMIIDKIKYKMLIYDCVRNFAEWKGYRSSVIKEEEWLIEKCDKIFTDSFFLTDNMKEKSNKEVVQFLPIANDAWLQGCKEKKVSYIKNIAYFGSVENHIDIDTLKELHENGFNVHFWGVNAK